MEHMSTKIQNCTLVNLSILIFYDLYFAVVLYELGNGLLETALLSLFCVLLPIQVGKTDEQVHQDRSGNLVFQNTQHLAHQQLCLHRVLF